MEPVIVWIADWPNVPRWKHVTAEDRQRVFFDDGTSMPKRLLFFTKEATWERLLHLSRRSLDARASRVDALRAALAKAEERLVLAARRMERMERQAKGGAE